MRNIGQLQQVIFHNVWEMDADDKGNPRTGWVYVLAIKDLSQLLDAPVPESGTELWAAWDKEWNQLKPGNESYDRVTEALAAVRKDAHALLRSLD